MPVSILGEVARAALQAADDRTQHVLEPMLVVADGLLELLERTPQDRRIRFEHGTRPCGIRDDFSVAQRQ
jgi:hypothetical protein